MALSNEHKQDLVKIRVKLGEIIRDQIINGPEHTGDTMHKLTVLRNRITSSLLADNKNLK